MPRFQHPERLVERRKREKLRDKAESWVEHAKMMEGIAALEREEKLRQVERIQRERAARQSPMVRNATGSEAPPMRPETVTMRGSESVKAT